MSIRKHIQKYGLNHLCQRDGTVPTKLEFIDESPYAIMWREAKRTWTIDGKFWGIYMAGAVDNLDLIVDPTWEPSSPSPSHTHVGVDCGSGPSESIYACCSDGLIHALPPSRCSPNCREVVQTLLRAALDICNQCEKCGKS